MAKNQSIDDDLDSLLDDDDATESSEESTDDLDSLLDDDDDSSEDTSSKSGKGKSGKGKSVKGKSVKEKSSTSKDKTETKNKEKTEKKKKEKDPNKIEGLTKETKETGIITFNEGSGSKGILILIAKFGYDRDKVLKAAENKKFAEKYFSKCDPAKKYSKVAGIIKNLQNSGYKLPKIG